MITVERLLGSPADEEAKEGHGTEDDKDTQDHFRRILTAPRHVAGAWRGEGHGRVGAPWGEVDWAGGGGGR
jgi:hypothetical protein